MCNVQGSTSLSFSMTVTAFHRNGPHKALKIEMEVASVTDLVTVLTEWYSGLVVVEFSRQGNVTLATLEAGRMVRPVQCFDGRLRQSHRFTAKTTQVWK